MRNMIRAKSLVIIIILLFVETSNISVVMGLIEKNNALPFDNQVGINCKDFDRRIEFLMKIGHMPSLSACIIKNSSVVWSHGYGLYDIKNNRIASNFTIYMAGSISKAFTATAILQLYEKNLFHLDDNVSERLPFDLKNPKYPQINITYGMLLSHQSGLTKNSLKGFFSMFLLNSVFPYDWYLNELFDSGNERIWSDAAPGENFKYSNIGFTILGYLIQQLSNQTFEEYCQQYMFTPLDMKDSSFHLLINDKSRYAIPYGGVLSHLPLPLYDLAVSSAGGLRTTVLDLAHFLIAHMNDGVYNGTRILKKETIELMHRIHTQNNSGVFHKFDYGYGWMIWNTTGETVQGHDGDVFGGAATMRYRASDKVGVIFFVNSKINGPLERIVESLVTRELFTKGDNF